MSSTPPGVRFQPTDEELLMHFLMHKILGQPVDKIPEIDVLKFEPGELHSNFGGKFGNEELFFFCQLKRKYSSGNRSDRTTKAGYWKPTGGARTIKSKDTRVPIGEKKILVFYEGHMPRSKRTSWAMHEYHLKPECLGDGHDKNKTLPYVLCRIKNSGKKPMTPTPVNHEGDDLSFRDNQHDEVVAAPREMPLGDLMESLLQSRPLNAMSSDYTTLAHQPQAGAEHGSSSLPGFSRGNDGTGLDFGLLPSPAGDHTLYPNYCQKCFEGYLFFECIKHQS